MKNIKHIGTLNGRIFLISEANAFKQWSGITENKSSETDYDLLDDFVSYEEADLTLFKKSLNEVFSIFFSMSSKIEIFKKDDGFIIFDGLYFNESWDYTIGNEIEIIGEINFEIRVNDTTIIIFDASVDGNKVLFTNRDGVWNFSTDLFNSYAIITSTKDYYKIRKVKTVIHYNNQEVIIKGIEFF